MNCLAVPLIGQTCWNYIKQNLKNCVLSFDFSVVIEYLDKINETLPFTLINNIMMIFKVTKKLFHCIEVCQRTT